MSDVEYFLPGMFDPLVLGDESALHQGGLDFAQVAQDPPDIFGNDPDLIDLTPDGPAQWNREHLPQFGPAFVPYVAQRFTRIEREVEKLLAKWQYEPVTVVFPATMNTDASGNINRAITPNAIVYEPPPGFTLALHRFGIFVGGSTFGAPFQGAGAYLEIRVNDEPVDGISLVAAAANGGSLPYVFKWGTRDAPRIRDGEVLSFFLNAGPASKAVTIKGQGTLERQPES